MCSLLRGLSLPLLIAGSLLFSELLLRLIPSPIQHPPLHEFDDPHSLLGVELVPGTVERVQSPCYAATVSTNRLGWRDRERTVERVPGRIRIAVLGDSFVEGTQVGDKETLTRRLEELLGADRVEVLNFGLSSIGTAQEEILYADVVSAYRPDIVLLGFTTNDVANSDPLLEAGPGGKTRLTYRDAEGNLTHERSMQPLFGLRKWLRTRSALFRLLKATHGLARRLREDALTEREGQSPPLPAHFAVFQTNETADWRRGWDAVEQALQRLKEEVNPPQRLIVFAVPDLLQIARDPSTLLREYDGVDPPTDFDSLHPHRRFLQIADDLRIEAIDLLPTFLAERDARGLQYPYFSFPCDGHWNAEGHRLAAATLAGALHSLLLPDAPRQSPLRPLAVPQGP